MGDFILILGDLLLYLGDYISDCDVYKYKKVIYFHTFNFKNKISSLI